MREAYAPDDSVIAQNEMFEYALKSAPNVLYGRYKQYGQVSPLSIVLAPHLLILTLTLALGTSSACSVGAPSSAS